MTNLQEIQNTQNRTNSYTLSGLPKIIKKNTPGQISKNQSGTQSAISPPPVSTTPTTSTNFRKTATQYAERILTPEIQLPQLRLEDRFMSEQIYEVPPSLLNPNPHQSRTITDGPKFLSLVASIKKYGILEPLLVRIEANNRFTLIAGRRRFDAARELEFPTVPCRLLKASEDDLLILTIIENLERLAMHPVDEIRAFQLLVDRTQSLQIVADLSGLTVNQITEKLKILTLASDVLDICATIPDLSEKELLKLLKLPKQDQKDLVLKMQAQYRESGKSQLPRIKKIPTQSPKTYQQTGSSSTGQKWSARISFKKEPTKVEIVEVLVENLKQNLTTAPETIQIVIGHLAELIRPSFLSNNETRSDFIVT